VYRTEKALERSMQKAGMYVLPVLALLSGCAGRHSLPVGATDGDRRMTSVKSMKVTTSGAVLHSEAFGDPGRQPVLLIMGAMASGRWWPDEFCRQLAGRGRYVIRYDHRDTGESTSYEPGKAGYKVEDLADDAVAVLDAHTGKRADLVGMSLGGYLSQLIALKYPDRVLSLTLIASERLALADPAMPGISPAVIGYHAKAGSLDWSDKKAVIDYQIGAWRLLTGSGRTFDARAVEEIAGADHDRTRNPLSAFNHAGLGDAEGWVGRLDEIRAPTLIIHGTEDPVHPYAHALALKSAIVGSSLLTLEGAGHELNRRDWGVMIDAILRHTRRDPMAGT
jgi:pimeloyl-ACP methyl ester carboxylesterase